MDNNGAMERLQSLRRDLIAFTESRMPNFNRLAGELQESIGELQRLVDRKKKSEESRKTLDIPAGQKHKAITIGDIKYSINEDFRAVVLKVADDIDLDELQAATRCFDVVAANGGRVDDGVAYRAILGFHSERCTILDCLRLLLAQTVDLEADDDYGVSLQESVQKILQVQQGNASGGSAYFRRCSDALKEVEAYLKQNAAHKQTAQATGQPVEGETFQFLTGQRMLLAQQHEYLAAMLSHLIRAGHASEADFRPVLTAASQQEQIDDIAIHYLPIIISGSAHFGASELITPQVANGLHSLFASGPTRLQWKQPVFRAAATICWLAEYNSRFQDPASSQTIRVADRQRQEEERQALFFECVKEKGFHFLLAACEFLRPDAWYDPAKVGLVRYLMEDTKSVEAAPALPEFASLTMVELQSFSEAFVANMPDALRRLKADEDDRRRNQFSRPPEAGEHNQTDLERFLVIMSYAYQDSPEAAQDFWSDKESNLYGFLRWASQRLPTPRVAAFCELLRSIAGDEKSANQAHFFLREDTTMTAGKLRRSYSVSWSQIFAELDIYASSVKNKPASASQLPGQNGTIPEGSYDEPETYLMLEAYLRLAAHLCRLSPEARNWMLREQSLHIGETLFHLASTGNDSRIHAVCFDVLAALLTDKIPEVNEGMWALLDNWVSGGGASLSRHGRLAHPEQRYLNNYVANPETATGLVTLLNTLVAPSRIAGEINLGSLPFPESLGSQNRQGGIDTYVDFVLGPVFRSTSSDAALSDGHDRTPIDVLRYACLEFICLCLSSFDENLVALANVADLGVDAAIRTSSLVAYVRLHPFARVMDWMFNNNVIHAFAHVVRQDIDILNQLSPDSPRVQATLQAIKAMNLALKLQTTYLDIIRPLLNKDPHNKPTSNANASIASYDEVILSQLDLVTDIVSFASSTNLDLSLESANLAQKLCSSRKLTAPPPFSEGSNVRIGSRLIGHMSEASDVIAPQVAPLFAIQPGDLDYEGQSPKLAQANAVLDVLNGSLDNAAGRPSVAHCLLGFACHTRVSTVEPTNAFAQGESLFHSIAICAVQAPIAVDTDNVSYLLRLKKACLDVVLKLALSQLTANIVLPALRSIDFLSALAQNQILAATATSWDSRELKDPTLLFDTSAAAVINFIHTRENIFEYAATELRKVSDMQLFSVQEKLRATLLGTIITPDGERTRTLSIFELFDFFDLETAQPLVASCKYLSNVDFSSCLKDDAESGATFDIAMAEELLLVRKRDLQLQGALKELAEEVQVDDEVRALCASLTSQNNWQAIHISRLSALEAWIDLMALLVTSSGLSPEETMSTALHGLQIVLSRLEKTLADNIDAAALLAKLTLILVQAVTAARPSGSQPSQPSGVVTERLISAFRVCLKVVTDSSSGLGLRDVCYRICCAVLAALPLTVINGKASPSTNARQLLQLIQTSGDRLITVATEDAFSGRGITRVSSLLFLDALLALSQIANVNSAMLRSLERLNFIPVLIDHSIGSVTSSFSGDNDELTTAVAYFHTALSLVLRVCQTSEGTRLTLDSGLFPAIAESRLFTTDPDIGLDIDNPIALREFYRLLSAVLRVVTAVVLSRGPGNAHILQQAKNFLQENRFSMQAVFKRTSAVQKTAGPPEKEAVVVADEFSRLLIVTGFLDVSALVLD
jgi:nuclear pore complex protein Nup205